MSRIGLFIKNNDSIFTNGCIQQSYFTYKCIEKSGYAIDFLTIDNDCKEFVDKKVIYVCDKINILKEYSIVIFGSLIINQYSILNIMKLYGVKIVHLIVGNYYILNCEEFVFNVHKGLTERLHNEYVDEIWLMPMYIHTIDYIKCVLKKPVKICPYVWDSSLVDKYIDKYNINPRYSFIESPSIDIIIMEPNMSIHKNGFPLLCALDKYFVENPHKINKVHFFCKPGHMDFMSMLNILDIVRVNKVIFYDRIISLSVFDQMNTKKQKYCVLSGNIRNKLNFLHLECLYLKIPIIHNCEPFKDNGLYYEDSDDKTDYSKLCSNLDSIYQNCYTPDFDKYNKIMNVYSTNNDNNITKYSNLISNLNNISKPSIMNFTDLLNQSDIIDNNDTILNKNAGIVISVTEQYDFNILKKNIDSLSQSNLNVSFYIFESVYDTVKNEIKRFVDNLKNRLIYNTICVTNKDVNMYAISDTKYKIVLFFNDSVISGININEIIEKFYNHNIDCFGFNIYDDVYRVDKCIHYISQIYAMIGIKYDNNLLLDHNIFFYKNSNKVRNIFKRYLKKIDILDDLIDNRFVIQILFSLCNEKINIMDIHKCNVYYGLKDSNNLVGYYSKNLEKTNILYFNIDVTKRPFIEIANMIYDDGEVSTYQYKVKDCLYRSSI